MREVIGGCSQVGPQNYELSWFRTVGGELENVRQGMKLFELCRVFGEYGKRNQNAELKVYMDGCQDTPGEELDCLAVFQMFTLVRRVFVATQTARNFLGGCGYDEKSIFADSDRGKRRRGKGVANYFIHLGGLLIIAN